MHNKPHSEETKERLRLVAKKLNIRPPSRKGSRWTSEQTEKMRKIMKGRIITWGNKISKSLTGKKQTEEHRMNGSKARKGLNKGIENKGWKGEKVSYSGLHYWIKRELGSPETCEHCGKTRLKGRKVNWANKSGKYKREHSDWIRLCIPCHAKYDGINERYKRSWVNQFGHGPNYKKHEL